MKDFLGQEVSVGDAVILTAYSGSGLSKGTIIKVNPKTVVIKTRDHWSGETRKSSDYFVKIPGGEA